MNTYRKSKVHYIARFLEKELATVNNQSEMKSTLERFLYAYEVIEEGHDFTMLNGVKKALKNAYKRLSHMSRYDTMVSDMLATANIRNVLTRCYDLDTKTVVIIESNSLEGAEKAIESFDFEGISKDTYYSKFRIKAIGENLYKASRYESFDIY